MHAELHHSKWSALRQLYQALLDGRFMATPGTMQLVAECLPQMAASYPREFLQFIARMPLQPAPELLGGKDTHTNPIPNRGPNPKTSPTLTRTLTRQGHAQRDDPAHARVWLRPALPARRMGPCPA